MKKRTRISLITNLILVFALVSVFGVSFLPDKKAQIVNSENLTAIYSGNKANNNVSLMFNVYENTEIVNKIINTLNENGVKATFFVGGCWADDNMETLNRIAESGHELANHGYFHKDHKAIDILKNKEEIENCDKVVYALTNVKMNLFAPPSGSYSKNTLKVANDLGYKVIMWTKDTIDWRDKDIDKVYERATKNISNGDLILMHPKEHTLLALNGILEYYRSVNLNVCTVSENISV